ncbi:KRF1 protein, partial [Odontophorus gujanensis]|nr:KRF1 protein [Odontophorus gujanensis]
VRHGKNYTVIIKPLPMIMALPGLILSSYLQNTTVGFSTSAAIGNTHSCDGVSVVSECFDLLCISRYHYSRRCPPC